MCYDVCLSPVQQQAMQRPRIKDEDVTRLQEMFPILLIAERLSARQLILRRISEIVCMYVYNMYVCMYVSVTLRNPIISRATRKRSITCASVTLRNVPAVPAIEEVRGEKSSAYNYSAGHRRRCTHTTQWRPAEYEPIRAACNRLAQLSTCIYIPAAETLRQWRETCAQHLDIRCARHSTAYAYL